jgi:hypothetical protein
MRKRAVKEHVQEFRRRRTKVQVASLLFIVLVWLWWDFAPKYGEDDWILIILLGVPLVFYTYLVSRCPACGAAVSRHPESCSKCGVRLKEK